MLVAGLMVHCHALRAGIVHARPTHDTDLVVEIGAVSYAEVARAILGLGFTLHEPLDSHAPVHRCVDGAGAIVDLMASDRRQEPARYVGRPVIHVPGSDPALKRTISHVLPTGGVVRLPDLPSALALESGAYFLPGVERERHLQDAVALLVCIDRGEVTLSRSMRRAVTKLLSAISMTPEAWQVCHPDDWGRAVRAARGLDASWQPPGFIRPRRPGRDPA